MKAGAILLCGGRGQRLGLPVDKAAAPLAGRPLFTWSLEALGEVSAIEGIVVVGHGRTLRDLLAAAGMAAPKVVGWTEGGRERQDSVARGLQALPAEFDLVAVHDSARALVEPALIGRVLGAAMEHGAAIPAVALEDTLKRASLRVIEDTVPRAGLWRAQTPQAFRRDWLEQAHAGARGRTTDDAALVEAAGHPVHLVEGDPMNFKITSPADLALAEAWLARART